MASKGTSLPQLGMAMLGFIVGFAGGIAIIMMITDGPKGPRAVYYIPIILVAVFTYGAHAIGGKLFPAEKHGKVNVRKIIWGTIGMLILATIALIAIAVSGR